MDLETILSAVTENPITAGAVGTAIAAVIAFFRPIMRALQRAFIRRIDNAWPDGDELQYDDKVQATADRMTLVPLSRSAVERAIRDHKSSPPPRKG